MRHNVLFATAFATLVSTSTFAADLPGKGITVQPVQSTISEESFQTLIVSRAPKTGLHGQHAERSGLQRGLYLDCLR